MIPTADQYFNGMRVILSPLLEQFGAPYEERRSWWNRLFSRPWRPFQKTRTIIPRVPYEGAYQINKNTLVMHPVTFNKLKGQQ
jgi:hypothetical protein